ncbi:hypothetical protein ACVK00_002841 [Burkholderia sp. PvR073]
MRAAPIHGVPRTLTGGRRPADTSASKPPGAMLLNRQR